MSPAESRFSTAAFSGAGPEGSIGFQLSQSVGLPASRACACSLRSLSLRLKTSHCDARAGMPSRVHPVNHSPDAMPLSNLRANMAPLSGSEQQKSTSNQQPQTQRRRSYRSNRVLCRPSEPRLSLKVPAAYSLRRLLLSGRSKAVVRCAEVTLRGRNLVPRAPPSVFSPDSVRHCWHRHLRLPVRAILSLSNPVSWRIRRNCELHLGHIFSQKYCPGLPVPWLILGGERGERHMWHLGTV
ncbi:MAG: hypothetical protein JWN34_6194 [Bryobacterales bacterium]|nr:hypothetical protein [Bryobacterales bacterium]